MSVEIGLKKCCLECKMPRLKFDQLDYVFGRHVNVNCECSGVCHYYMIDEGDTVSAAVASLNGPEGKREEVE